MNPTFVCALLCCNVLALDTAPAAAQTSSTNQAIARAAGPVYQLLAKQDMGTTNMPAPDEELISGDLAFREHAGGHTDLPDWPTFLKFADKYFKSP
jgi:hypothetical protein